jgi:N-acetylmuramoyl-L-alanine amidase-like protein
MGWARASCRASIAPTLSVLASSLALNRVIAAALGALVLTLPRSSYAEEEEEEDELPPSMTSSTARGAAETPAMPALNLYNLLPPDALAAEIERRHRKAGAFPVLIERISRGLVGAPYLLSPLGEGALPDADPTFRLDAFDCTTFVETAMALSRCDDLRDIERSLDRIRYQNGVAKFAARRHLMTSQWIPGLVKAGYLEDVTQKIGGKQTKWIKLKLDQKRWASRRVARTLKLEAAEIPVGTFPIPYLPVKTVLAKLKDVPAGTILNVVRTDVPWSPDVITHQGLVLLHEIGATRFVRHASPVAKRVIDETLEHMMRRYQRPKGWAVAGVNFLRLVDPLPGASSTVGAR